MTGLGVGGDPVLPRETQVAEGLPGNNSLFSGQTGLLLLDTGVSS